MRYISLGGESWYFLRVGPSTPARRHPSTAELGALGLVLRRVALEVGERVERRRREPGEEGQRADGEARQRRRDEWLCSRDFALLNVLEGISLSANPDTMQSRTRRLKQTTLTQEASRNIARALSPNSDRSAATAAGVTSSNPAPVINARQIVRA